METHFDELREYKDPEIIQCFILSCEYFEPDYGNLKATWWELVGCCKGVLLIKHPFGQTKSFVFGAYVVLYNFQLLEIQGWVQLFFILVKLLLSDF